MDENVEKRSHPQKDHGDPRDDYVDNKMFRECYILINMWKQTLQTIPHINSNKLNAHLEVSTRKYRNMFSKISLVSV